MRSAADLWPAGHDTGVKDAAGAELARKRMVWFARDALERSKHARSQGRMRQTCNHDGWFYQMDMASLHIRRALFFSAQLRTFAHHEQLAFDI